jgi:hypothetical protein
MIPLVFISSTIEDLHHLRDAVRDTVEEIGYIPIMSDYGDIGYLPYASVEDSCYQSMADCQFAVLIIGKRYGSESSRGLSITQNEFRTAQKNEVPLLTLIDKEVLSFKRVYEANKDGKAPKQFPGMDDPENTFSFINEIMEASNNNGILPFNNVTDVRTHLKKQFANIFGDLLRNKQDILNASLNDVISEIKTLRHDLSGGNPPDSNFFLTIRRLIDEKNKTLRKLIESAIGPIDTAVPTIFKADDFKAFMEKYGYNIEIINPPRIKTGNAFLKQLKPNSFKSAASFIIEPHMTANGEPDLGDYAIMKGKTLKINTPALDYLNKIYNRVKNPH